MKQKKDASTERMLFASFYRGNKLLWAAVMVLSVAVSVGNVTCSWLLKESIDVIATQDMDYLLKLFGICVVFVVLWEASALLQKQLKAVFLKRAVKQYRSTAFEKLSQKSISAFTRENTGRYISVLTNDIQTIKTDYLSSSFSIVVLLLSPLGSTVLLFRYGGALAWVCIGFSLVPVGLSLVLSKELRRRTQTVSVRNEHFVARIKDLLSGFVVLKSFKAEKEAGKLFDDANEQTEHSKMRQAHWKNMMDSIQDICSLALQFGMIFAGTYLAIRGSFTPGSAVIMVNLCGNIVGAISSFSEVISARRAAKGLVVKLAQLIDENEVQYGEAIEPVLREHIRLENVSFGYETDKPVLQNIELRFDAGKRYAIVGASGSGKSTLLNLLMGGYDGYSGSITIDGQEIRSIAPNSLYDLMSLIGQNVFVFDNTIRENITMFRDFPQQAVESAVERAGLACLIGAKGEDYRCGENGVGLSGGERQRISIARALLRETPVLMLDEATAALDNQTAFEVTDSILKLDGLTRIVVTHRLEENLLRRYDEIIVLRDGRIAESGSFKTLMRKTGYFYSLYHVTNG